MTTFHNLPLPCPVNRLWRSFRGRNILSKEAREKSAALTAAIKERLPDDFQTIATTCAVTIAWCPARKIRCDVDAYCKQVLDCLTAAEVIEDDRLVHNLAVDIVNERSGIAKGTMRVRVWMP